MTSHLSLDRTLWRVGYHADPLGVHPAAELYAFNHRFDDLHHRFAPSTAPTSRADRPA